MEAHTHTHTKPKPLEKVERETAELITKIDKVVTASSFPGHHSQPFFVAFNEWVSPLKFRLFRTRTEPGSWDPTVRDWDQRFFFFFLFLIICFSVILVSVSCHAATSTHIKCKSMWCRGVSAPETRPMYSVAKTGHQHDIADPIGCAEYYDLFNSMPWGPFLIY